MGCWRGEGPARPSEPLSPPPGAMASGGGLPFRTARRPWLWPTGPMRRKCWRVERETGAGPGAGLRVSGCPLGDTGVLLRRPQLPSPCLPALWVSPTIPFYSPLRLTPPNFLRFSLMSPAPHRLQVGTVWINAHGLRTLQCPHGWLQGERGPPGMGGKI